MIKIANIVGARPQFIKYCPVMRAIARHNSNGNNAIRDILIHTGQHYDYAMSKVFFDDFGIREPDYHLEVGSGSHAEQTAQIMIRVEAILGKEHPNLILVYGDTNSTLGAALAGAKIHIPISHVEAGLRSFNKFMPEEINRILTDEISTILFCPSKVAIENLKQEGYGPAVDNGELISLVASELDYDETIPIDKNHPCIVNIGDIMYDVLNLALSNLKNRPSIVETLGLQTKAYYLLTLHRAENTDSVEQLGQVLKFVHQVSQNYPIIFPIHPRTKKTINQTKLALPENVKPIDPLGYFDMVGLMKNSLLVLTDSGGIQKEAYWLEVPCITLREETEWVETVESGWNVLYKNFQGSHHPMQHKRTAYGDGQAAERLVNIISLLQRNF
jgi:UDP-GlcNAc3NAcA epimerase